VQQKRLKKAPPPPPPQRPKPAAPKPAAPPKPPAPPKAKPAAAHKPMPVRPAVPPPPPPPSSPRVVPGAEWADPARRSLAQRPRPAPASAPLCAQGSTDAAASWFGSSEAWARAPTQLLAPSLEEEAALFRALDVVDDLPLPARWHARGDAAYALPASVKTELDGCVAAGVFAAEQLDDDAVATLVRSCFRAPLACVRRLIRIACACATGACRCGAGAAGARPVGWHRARGAVSGDSPARAAAGAAGGAHGRRWRCCA
jgi:hypothetical protein